MNKHQNKKTRERDVPSRKKQALRDLKWLLLLFVISGSLQMRNVTESQALRMAERQKGWPTMRLIWEQEEENTWLKKSKVQMYVYEDACVFAEMTWNLRFGWECELMSVVEQKEGQPINSAYIDFDGRQIVYTMGYITDEQVEVEDITYQIWWEEGNVKEEFTIDDEECVYDHGARYFVHKTDYSYRTTEEERQYMGLFIHVKDKNGQPILWEDGYADDFGDWMIVTIGYGTSR